MVVDMSSVDPGGASKRDLNDSGCVQDASPVKMESPVKECVSLLDLSDDVLLCIFKFCSPRDLKALGFTCGRLGSVILDRSLWRCVSERTQPTGRRRMRWYMTRALSEHTDTFACIGYAWEPHQCLDFISRLKILSRTAEQKEEMRKAQSASTSQEAKPAEGDTIKCMGETCAGPYINLTPLLLKSLRETCVSLRNLALDYCNIDCSVTLISQFPRTLRTLSLRGSKCYNLPLDKSFMFRIHDHLHLLEELDVSSCEWMDGAVLLPLSKLPRARKLVAQNCHRLTEFVAYSSISSRYGFRNLKILDVRGSPLADSEVSSLGWLPELEELYLSVSAPPLRPHETAQYRCSDHLLDHWETQEPEYFKKDTDIEENDEPEMVIPHTHRLPHPDLHTYASPPAPTMPAITNVLTISFNRNSDTNRLENVITRHRIQDGQVKTVDSFDDNPSEQPEVGGRANSIVEDLARQIRKRDNAGLIIKRRKPKKNDDESSEDEIEHLVVPNENMDRNEQLEIQKLVVPKANAPNQEGADTIHRLNLRISQAVFEKGVRAENVLNKPQEVKVEPNIIVPPNKDESEDEDVQKAEKTKKRSLDSDSSDDEVLPIPIKRVCERTGLNVGASTSKDETNAKSQKYVRFCRNQPPTVVSDSEDISAPGPSRSEHNPSLKRSLDEPGTSQSGPSPKRPNPDPNNEDLYQSVLYLYRVPNQEQPRPQFHRARQDLLNIYRQMQMPIVGDILDQSRRPHVDPNSLVSDLAIRKFGHSDDDDVNFVHLHGMASSERPKKSKLKILVATGYNNITNSSLDHLATAAPNLTYVDFTGTRVNESGVVAFKSLKSDCEVRYGEINPGCL